MYTIVFWRKDAKTWGIILNTWPINIFQQVEGKHIADKWCREMSRAHSPTFPSLHLRHNSFSNPSVALSTSQLILQLFRCFAYVTVHSPTLLSIWYHGVPLKRWDIGLYNSITTKWNIYNWAQITGNQFIVANKVSARWLSHRFF